MRTLTIITSSLLLGLSIIAAHSQTASPSPAGASRLGLLKRASEVLGQTVRDRNDRKLGKIDDLIGDLESGRLTVALVSTGSKKPFTPVPASSFLAADSRACMISAERKVFYSAPTISAPDPAGKLDASRLNEVYRHFGQASPGLATKSVSVTRLEKAALQDETGQNLGTIDDVMVDVPAGLMVYLVVKPAGTDQDSFLYVVPPSTISAENGKLVYHGNAERLARGPHFRNNYWAELSQPQLAVATAEYYPGGTLALTAPIANRQPVRARVSAGAEVSVAATKPGSSDEEKTLAVRQVVMSVIAREFNSFVPHGIRIQTVNGRVTIAGHLNQWEKDEILRGVRRVVDPRDLDDQLDPREN